MLHPREATAYPANTYGSRSHTLAYARIPVALTNFTAESEQCRASSQNEPTRLTGSGKVRSVEDSLHQSYSQHQRLSPTNLSVAIAQSRSHSSQLRKLLSTITPRWGDGIFFFFFQLSTSETLTRYHNG